LSMSQHPSPDRAGIESRSPNVGQDRRVLVVDDDPLNRKLAELQLHDAGFSVDTADSAEAALAKASAAPPDAILSDIQMPGMDGFQLREALRRDTRLARIPIILVSSAMVEERARRVNERFDATCVLRSADLHEAIEALTAALVSPAP